MALPRKKRDPLWQEEPTRGGYSDLTTLATGQLTATHIAGYDDMDEALFQCKVLTEILSGAGEEQ